MEKQCPYCDARVSVTGLARHVRLAADDDHGPYGTLPDAQVDSPWSSRVEFSDHAQPVEADPAEVEAIKREVRRGRCPSCDRGMMALKGGDGFLSSGRRRLACPNCGWETPEWVELG